MIGFGSNRRNPIKTEDSRATARQVSHHRPFIVRITEGVPRKVFQQINVLRHLDQFNRGLVTAESVVFFLACTALFLFLAIKVVESRRWR